MSPTTPRESAMSRDAVSAFDGDIKPEGYPRHQQQVPEDNVESSKLVDELGSGSRGYRRHRQTALKNLVSEIYSKPRVSAALKLLPGMGLSAGFALDLTTTDENGDSWDFTKECMREKAKQKIKEEEPMLLIGSPNCTAFRAWQALNAARHGTREFFMIVSPLRPLHVCTVCLCETFISTFSSST